MQLFDLSSCPQHALSNITAEMSSPYSVSEYKLLYAAATTLHLSTEAARSIVFSIGYYTDSIHNLLKVNIICRKTSRSATGAALLCCDFFLLLILSRLYHTLFCFCLDGTCLCAFSAFHCLKAIWINAIAHLNLAFSSKDSSLIAGLEIQLCLVSCAASYQNAVIKKTVKAEEGNPGADPRKRIH